MDMSIDAAIIFTFSFFVAAIIAVQIIEFLLNIIVVPWFGYRILGGSIFGFIFLRKKNEWRVSFNHLSPVCECYYGYDIRKPLPEDAYTDNAYKKDKQVAYLVRVLALLVCLVIAFVFSDYIYKLFHGKIETLMDKYIAVFAASFVAGIFFHSVCHIGFCIYAFQISAKRMAGYADAALRKLRQGYSFEALNLKPIEELTFKKVTKIEKLCYYNLYIYYLVSTGQVEELHKVTREITEMLETAEFIVNQADLYYWLVYYYSKYSINFHRAEQFLKKVWPVLSMDSDADAKRVLAQYYFRIQGDLERARQYLREGLECVDDFPIAGQRELEKKMLEELAEELGSQNI